MNNAEALKKIIKSRRTIKPGQMNGKAIPNEQIMELLELADWAPTHGNTEPWRFFVYAGNEKVKAFCEQHAALYEAEAGDKTDAARKETLLHMGDKASHVILAAMKRGHLTKIPVLEELAATSAAIQHLLLGAESMGIAAYWGSGGMVLRPSFKEFLGLGEEDQMLGALYFGYSDVLKEGQRVIPLQEKIRWM